MTPESHKNIETALPTRKAAMIFRGKATLLQARRAFNDTFSERMRKFKKVVKLSEIPVLASSITPLWTESEPEEQFLVAGKIENLRIAARLLNGIEIPAGEIFSFWKNFGRVTRRRGFTVGREIREGCVIPNIGGGLCQISNALYATALAANCEIVERHAHSRVIAGSLAEKDLDATVFWNYVDLRFRPQNDMRIEVVLDAKDLIIRFRGEQNASKITTKKQRRILHESDPNSCATCGEGDCFRSIDPAETTNKKRTAYLVDEFTAEFDDHISAEKTKDDVLMLPIDGKRFRKANYAWRTDGFDKTKQSLAITFLRSYRSRKLAKQGAERQRNLLSMSERLALDFARKLRPDMLHLVVQQNLLPYLWRNGDLGGRTFDVLMTALPTASLQERLDLAHSRNPESTTLGDFRAAPELVKNESDALAAAAQIITPHTEIASLFPQKAKTLDWKMPPISLSDQAKNEKFTVVFPATTVGRKGCYELRDAIRDLNLRLVLLGPVIESPNFWDGFDVILGYQDSPLSADLVVLPAYVEHRPLRLLKAAAAGVPVIASSACGVENIDEIETIDITELDNLKQVISKYL